jgi:hypothetical protein
VVVVTFLVDRIAVMIERCVGGGATTVGSVAGSVDEPGFHL